MSIQGESNPTLSPGIGQATRYASWIADEAQDTLGESVLEIGLGEGNYFGHLSKGRRYVGIDNHAPTVGKLLRDFPDRDYRLADACDSRLHEELGESFPSLVCCNVLEHVEDDVAFLRNLGSVATSGGRLFLFVPAFPRLFNDMDRLAGHYRRYAKDGLSEVVRASGWTLDEITYFNPIGVATWWLQGLGTTDALDSPSVTRRIRFFDRYLVPLSRRLTPVARNRLGQSLVAKATWNPGVTHDGR